MPPCSTDPWVSTATVRMSGVSFLQKPRHAGEGSARSDPGNEGIDTAFHLLPYLYCCCVVMELRVRLVLELQRGKCVRIVLG